MITSKRFSTHGSNCLKSHPTIALRGPAYGYRQVLAELLRQGWTINHKRVLRLLRVDNLLCVRRRKFLLVTTDSRHGLPIYPNLAAGMVLTSIDQLRVAAITYIRLLWEFGYLAVVLDAFSRRSLESALVLEALRVALMRRRPRPELVHHSDRGVQYASRDYTAQLEQHGIRISMSRLATPNDRSSGSFYGSGVRSCFRCGGWIDEDEFERYRRVNTSALATYRGCWERELCSVLNQETTKVFHRLSKKKIATPDCELL